MAIGTVKWFNNAKGFGFVRPETGGDDLFVHFSYINMDGYRSLRAGQQVSYDLQAADGGFHAVNIRILSHTAVKDRPVHDLSRASARPSLHPSY